MASSWEVWLCNRRPAHARQCKMRRPEGGSGVAAGVGFAVGVGLAVAVGVGVVVGVVVAIGLAFGIGEGC